MKTTTVLLSWMIAGAAYAGPELAHDRMEKAQDRRELRQDNRALRDDRRDALQMQALAARFDASRGERNWGVLDATELEIKRALDVEIQESRWEAVKDAAEMARSRGEVRRDRVELATDPRIGERMDDRRDLREDRRDARDDRRDLAREQISLERKRQIRGQLETLYARHDPYSLNNERALIGELVGMARGEIIQDKQERREDRRELREDRRETREDWRQGK